ncbi:MAG: dihydropteroate synthase [Alphaproteobacteria bacterium]|nr:MAG: dihydropteroate synthase [Alphaproteobacteria bacterium]
MSEHILLHPLGLLAGRAAQAAVKEGKAGWLAGGPLAFSLAEIIQGEAGAATRESVEYGALAASSESAVAGMLERVSAQRAPLCGLTFDAPRIMGVVNVTPDSFSDGGLYDSAEAAVAHAARLISEGAAIIDVGGESTRPGAEPVEAELESARILPVISGLRGVDALISADTRKADVIARAAEAGAQIINDISALTYDPDSLGTVAAAGLPVILMHAQGDPRTMQDNPTYADVVLEVFAFLAERIEACVKAGIGRERIIADPGIGFGKTTAHNLELLASFSLFHGLGVPLLIGVSRKRFIGELTGEAEPAQRVAGSLAGALAAVSKGCQILRVHDVRETARALAVWERAIHGP